jgi:hypothetical protein
MSIAEQDSAFMTAGFFHVEQMLLKGSLVMHRAGGAGLPE